MLDMLSFETLALIWCKHAEKLPQHCCQSVIKLIRHLNIRVWSTKRGCCRCLQYVKYTFVLSVYLHGVCVLHTQDWESTQQSMLRCLISSCLYGFVDTLYINTAKLHLAWSCLSCSSNDYTKGCVQKGVWTAIWLVWRIDPNCMLRKTEMRAVKANTNKQCISHKTPWVDISKHDCTYKFTYSMKYTLDITECSWHT